MGFQLCQWIESCIARNMYHTYTTQKHTSNSATVWEPSIFFFSILILLAFLNPFFLFIISDIAWCILLSSAERNSMEQGRKVSEHATPLARNFSSIGKDVESGNVPLVRIFFIASSVLSRGATLFPPGVCSLLFVPKKKKSLQSSFVGISPSVHLQFLLHRVNRQLKWLQNEPPKRNTVATLPTNILQSETKAAVWNQWSKCRRGSHRPPSTLRPKAQKSRLPRVQNQNHHQLKRPQGGPQWRWVFRTSEQAWAPRSSSVWARPRVSGRTRPLRNRSMRSSGNWNGIRAARMRITSTTTMGYPDDDGGGNTKERGLWEIKMA